MKFDAHWKKPIPGYETRISLWKRFVAFLIDIIVFDLVVATPLSVLIPSSLTATMAATPTILAVGTVLVTLFFSYLVISQYLIGQTIGMLFLRYRATNHEQLWRCIMRNVFILPIFPFFLLWVIDPLVLVFTGDRLTERWAGSTTEGIV